jgi:sporulation protein YlmC with PRC-barrel domain
MFPAIFGSKSMPRSGNTGVSKEPLHKGGCSCGVDWSIERKRKVSKIYVTATVALALAAAVPAAYAQTSATDTRAVTRSASPAQTIQPDQVRASKMIGSAVYDVQNRKIGSVRDLILDKSGKVDAAVVDVGSFLGMGGKDVAISLSDIKTDHNRLTLDRSKEQLQQMAEYRLEDRNTGAGTSTSPTEGGRLGTGSSTTR